MHQEMGPRTAGHWGRPGGVSICSPESLQMLSPLPPFRHLPMNSATPVGKPARCFPEAPWGPLTASGSCPNSAPPPRTPQRRVCTCSPSAEKGTGAEPPGSLQPQGWSLASDRQVASEAGHNSGCDLCSRAPGAAGLCLRPHASLVPPTSPTPPSSLTLPCTQISISAATQAGVMLTSTRTFSAVPRHRPPVHTGNCWTAFPGAPPPGPAHARAICSHKRPVKHVVFGPQALSCVNRL